MNSPLRTFLRRFDETDSRVWRMVQLYRGAISAVKDHLVISRASERTVFRVRFERLLSKIEQWSTDEQEFGESLTGFIGILSDYRVREDQEFAEQQQQLRVTVSNLASLVETIRLSHGERGRELEAVTMALEKALFEPDVHRIHECVQHQVRTLKTSIVRISELSFGTAQTVAKDILGLQRMTAAENNADEHGEAGQGDGDHAVLEDFIGRYEIFSVLSAKLDGLDDIELDLGKPAAKQILSEFSKRVQRACVDVKTKQLWHRGEVLIILNQAAPQARNRETRLRINLAEPFTVASKAGNAEFRLRTQIGLTEYSDGEKLDELLSRIRASTIAVQETA
jgi:GGDEF domain-containing protein